MNIDNCYSHLLDIDDLNCNLSKKISITHNKEEIIKHYFLK
jgi:hypothetical protein